MVKRKTAPTRNVSSSDVEQSQTQLSTRSSLSKRASEKVSRKRQNPKRKRETTRMLLGNRKYNVYTTVLKEIRKLQSQTKNLIPKLPFCRLIREILMEYSSEVTCIQVEALRGLQEAAEMFLTNLFIDANKLAMHAKRVTIFPIDLQLALSLRESSAL